MNGRFLHIAISLFVLVLVPEVLNNQTPSSFQVDRNRGQTNLLKTFFGLSLFAVVLNQPVMSRSHSFFYSKTSDLNSRPMKSFTMCDFCLRIVLWENGFKRVVDQKKRVCSVNVANST